MSKYSADRLFTNYVHQHLALPLIYEPLGWKKLNINPQRLDELDIKHGIDYGFSNSGGEKFGVQERFRDEFYASYSDFTIRYRRDLNDDISKHESEFYKIKAKYMVYGITNGKKFDDQRQTLTDFLKYVVIDLPYLFEQMKHGKIVLRSGAKASFIEDGKMIVPIISNNDPSSSFVAFDILQLHLLFGHQKIILLQKGFF